VSRGRRATRPTRTDVRVDWPGRARIGGTSATWQTARDFDRRGPQRSRPGAALRTEMLCQFQSLRLVI